MKRLALQILFCLTAAGAAAFDLREVAEGDAAELLDRKCIRSESCAVRPVRYDSVLRYLEPPDLLQRLYADYLRTYGEHKAARPLVRTGPQSYSYAAGTKKETAVTELYCGASSAQTYDFVYYVEGRRMGRYEMLVHVRVIDAGPAGTAYAGSMYAYPHSGPVRFFVRHFGRLEQYFHYWTRVFTRVVERESRAAEDFTGPLTPSPLPRLDGAQ